MQRQKRNNMYDWTNGKELVRKENCDAKKMPWIENNRVDKKKGKKKSEREHGEGMEEVTCTAKGNAMKREESGREESLYSIKRDGRATERWKSCKRSSKIRTQKEVEKDRKTNSQKETENEKEIKD